ncbi:MAG: PAS domain-containing protein [Rhizomicrobium sp.]
MTDTGATTELALAGEKLVAVQKTWRALAAGGIGPRREDVTPARLRATIPWTFLIDVVGADFRFRFAGDRIIQFMGRRLQGSLLSEHRGTPFFDGMHDFFSRCVAAKTPQVSGPARALYPGKEHLEMEVVVLPLCDDGLSVTGLLGAFETWRFGTHASIG